MEFRLFLNAVQAIGYASLTRQQPPKPSDEHG